MSSEFPWTKQINRGLLNHEFFSTCFTVFYYIIFILINDKNSNGKLDLKSLILSYCLHRHLRLTSLRNNNRFCVLFIVSSFNFQLTSFMITIWSSIFIFLSYKSNLFYLTVMTSQVEFCNWMHLISKFLFLFFRMRKLFTLIMMLNVFNNFDIYLLKNCVLNFVVQQQHITQSAF
jgi:hypothetical protein